MNKIKSKKIQRLKDLTPIIQKLKAKGKRIAHSHGVFDLLHPGHIQHFQEAKNQCDILIVTITKDQWVNKGPGRPAFNERLRVEAIAALESVDYVAINDWPTAIKTIKFLKPDIYFKGSDYRNRQEDITGMIYAEEKAVKSVGGSISFTHGITFSSSGIINQYFSVYPEGTEVFLQRFKKKYPADYIIAALKDLKKMKVLVIGDAIIDEYHYCYGMGKPQKADIIATKYANEEWFTGGALAIAKHVANFCDNTHLVSVIGNKPQYKQSTKDNLSLQYKQFIEDNLPSSIKAKFFTRTDVPTIVKRRFLNPAFLNKNFEIYYFDDRELQNQMTEKISSYLSGILPKYDLVIVADFGHGFMNQTLVNTVCRKAKFLAVNAQLNSANMGYNLITKYPRADFICIDEPELRLAMRDKFGDIKKIVKDLKRQIKFKNVIITRGHNGAAAFDAKGDMATIPVLSKEIVDRLGAGDAFLSITAPIVCKGFPMEMAGFIGSAVGALAVLIVGNKNSIEPVPLYKFITAALK